jgi:hypothetical protein
MVAKKKIGNMLDGPTGSHRYFFMCPGCGYAHCFTADSRTYNNDAYRPTISDPIIIPGDLALFHCHSQIKDGEITFHKECTHELAGFTYNLPDIK